MKTRIIINLLICLIIILIISANIIHALSTYNINHTNNQHDENETHIIDNPKVKYVTQETGFYCRFASLTMLINHFIDNVTLKEVLFNSGIGFSLMYFYPFKIHPTPGIFNCQLGETTGNYLAEIYGLSYELWKPKNSVDIWSQYWLKLKEKIKDDIPVLTDIDPFSLPWYKENINAPNNTHSSHSIVIVGFNESSGVIYFNDPGPTVGGESEEKCTYINMSIETFKEALKFNTFPTTNYMIESFERESSLLSKKEAFNRSFKRNIEMLKGNYPEKILNFIPLTDFGIKALKAMKRDLSIGFRHRFSTILLMKILKNMNFTISDGQFEGNLISSQTFNIIAIEKQNISQYLLENQYLSPICKQMGNLLIQESNLWRDFYFLINKLFHNLNDCIFKINYESIKMIKQIMSKLDEIISVEQAIIDGFLKHNSLNNNFIKRGDI